MNERESVTALWIRIQTTPKIYKWVTYAKEWPTHSKMQLCRENLRARAALYNIKYYTAQLNMTDCMCPWYWP